LEFVKITTGFYKIARWRKSSSQSYPRGIVDFLRLLQRRLFFPFIFIDKYKKKLNEG